MDKKAKTVPMNSAPKPKQAEKPEQEKLSYEQLEQIAQQQFQQLMQQREQLMQLNVEHISFKFGISLEILKLGHPLFHKDFVNKVADEVEEMYESVFKAAPEGLDGDIDKK